jgi:hypothetical protein
MPHVTFPTSTDGLIIDALVGLPGAVMTAIQQSGKPIPPPVLIRALVDTGADATSLSGGCAMRVGLKTAGRQSMQTAGGSVIVNQYDISFSISAPHQAGGILSVRPDLRVTEWLYPGPGLDALVGMDVLSEGLLILDGPGRQFTLAF